MSQNRKASRRTTLLASVALVALGAIAVPVLEPYAVNAATEATAVPAAPGSLVTADGSYSAIVKQDKPAVVTVMVEVKPGEDQNAQMQGQMPPGMEDFFRRFFGDNGPMPGGPQGGPQQQQRVQRALGSGFIISPDGVIVTNNHVIDKASKITVTLDDGKQYKAKLLGADPRTDLAVLKIDAKNLPTLQWGDSDTAEVGDKVIAIGNPFGVGTTVTAGIISARGRDLHNGPYDDFLQVDAAINHGNSGGALINTSGQVIGITAAIYSPNDGSVGVGFAIPSDMARKIVGELEKDGTIQRGYLGVMIQPVTEDIAQAVGLSDKGGALVSAVTADTPAAKAGLKVGDVILSVDGKDVSTPRDLSLRIAETKPGDKADLTVWRDGGKTSVDVTTASLPDEMQTASAAPTPQEKSPAAVPELGLQVQPIQPDERDQLGLADNQNGVVVTEIDPNSDAADKGLQPGDVILSVNSAPVTSVGDVEKAVKATEKSGHDVALLLIARQGTQQFVALPIKAS